MVRKAGLGDGDPKVLATYQLDPGLPENERKKRARKLTQNPRKYLRIIEAAAELANADPEQFTWDVFGSTSFAHAPGRELTEEEEVRRLGLECLETACQRIATELELKKWGERASAAGLVWTMSGWHQFGGSRPSDSSFEGATRADYRRAPLYLLEVCRGKSHAFDPQSGSTLEVEIFYGQRVFIALVGTRPAILRQAATVVEGDDQRIEVLPGLPLLRTTGDGRAHDSYLVEAVDPAWERFSARQSYGLALPSGRLVAVPSRFVVDVVRESEARGTFTDHTADDLFYPSGQVEHLTLECFESVLNPESAGQLCLLPRDVFGWGSLEDLGQLDVPEEIASVPQRGLGEIRDVMTLDLLLGHTLEQKLLYDEAGPSIDRAVRLLEIDAAARVACFQAWWETRTGTALRRLEERIACNRARTLRHQKEKVEPA